MISRFLLVALALAAAGCAHRDPATPVCDGLARRPANPHGSVLVPDTGPPVLPASATPAAGSGGCA